MQQRNGHRVWVYLSATALFLYFATPILFMISTSLKSPSSVFTYPVHFFPSSLYLKNYSEALSPQFLRYFLNSFIVAICTTILALIFTIFAGYAFSRLHFPGRKALLYSIIFTQLLPLIVLLIPLYRIMNGLHLLNTYQGLIISYLTITLPVAIWLLHGFFSSIPRELEECAEIDGCSRIGAFFRIMIPLSLPGIVATGSYVLFVSWQEFMFALTFMSSNSMATLPVGIMSFIGQHSTNWGVLMAASTLIQIPIIIIFGFAQNAFISGLAAGGVKG